MKRSLLLSSLLIFLLGTPLMGQIDSLLNLNPTLEDLMNMEVTSASRFPEKIDEAPGTIFVLTDREIRRRGYRTLDDMFRDLPGFDFSTGQPSGEYPAHFSFRGISDVGQTKILLMVDGVIQNDVSNGWIRHTGFDFTLNDIKRVEVVAGPGSALYGANAFAGLVHIITKQPEDFLAEGKNYGLTAQGQVLAGTQNTVAPELMVSGKSRAGVRFQLAGRWYYSQGDGGVNRYDPGNYFHNNFEPDSVLTREHGVIANERNPDGSPKALPDGFKNNINDYYIRGMLGKDGFRMKFNVWNKQEGLGSEVVGYEYFANTDSIPYQIHHGGLALTAEFEEQIGRRTESLTRAYYRHTRVLPETQFVYTYQYQSVDNGTDSAVVDKSKSYNGNGLIFGVEQQFNISLNERNMLTLGFQGEQLIRQYWGIALGEEQSAISTVVGSTFPAETDSSMPVFFTKRGAVFLEDDHNFGDFWHLNAGVRYDIDQQYGAVINPRISLVRAPESGVTLKLQLGQGFKAPTVFELYDEWRGNLNLEPERITSGELELGYRFPHFGTLKADLFASRLENLIEVLPNPDTNRVPIGPSGQRSSYYQNQGTRDVLGASLRGDFSPLPNLFVYGNYTYTVGGDLQPIAHIARHKFQAGVNYELLGKMDINLRVNHYGKVTAPETNWYYFPKTPARIAEAGYDYVTESDPDGMEDGFWLVNLTLTGKNLFEKINLEPQLVVRNLLNTEYLTVGRQDGAGLRPVDALQTAVRNPRGFIPAYHPQPGREIFLSLRYTF